MNDRLVGPAIGAGATGVAAMMDLNFAGIMAGLGVLGTGGLALWYQYSQTKLKIYREFEAGKLEVQKLHEEQNKVSLSAKVKQLEDDLAGSRDRRHKDANKFNGILFELQVKADLAEKKATEAAIRAARLEGQLGVIDRTHAENINANIQNIDVLAEQAGVKLPAHPPPVEPIVSPEANHLPEVLDPSDDDLTPFFRH